MDCLFCGIASGEIPSLTIYEDNDTRAFLDIHPLTLGHTVVIPKKHADNIIDLGDGSVGSTFLGVKRATEILEKSLGASGFTIGINHGTIGHQEIDHLHIHVIPRSMDDGGGGIHSVVNMPPKESLEEVYKRIQEGKTQ